MLSFTLKFWHILIESLQRRNIALEMLMILGKKIADGKLCLNKHSCQQKVTSPLTCIWKLRETLQIVKFWHLLYIILKTTWLPDLKYVSILYRCQPEKKAVTLLQFRMEMRWETDLGQLNCGLFIFSVFLFLLFSLILQQPMHIYTHAHTCCSAVPHLLKQTYRQIFSAIFCYSKQYFH